MMRAVSAAEALNLTGDGLGCPQPSDAIQLLKPALRRAVHILAPAARGDLVRFVAESFAPFGDLREAIEAALDEMIVYGDILEMRRQDHDAWGTPAEVLRPAPPSFVRQGDGEFIILGVAGDYPSPLSQRLAAQIIDDGLVRRLRSDVDDLPTHLRLLGLVPISEQAWLRTPQAEAAASHVTGWSEKLEATQRVEHAVDGLEILDGARDPRFYRGRWREPQNHSGMFVARRPQLYGALLWSLVWLEAGQPKRLLDLYADDDRQQPRDLAWRIQAALDAECGVPQRVRVRRHAGSAMIDLFSPLPAFAERRLALVATKSAGIQCLYSYALPDARLGSELAALRTMLWMCIDEEQA